jgi:hypothetical protein
MKKRVRNSPQWGDLRNHNRWLWMNPHAMRVDPEPPLATACSRTMTTTGAPAGRGRYKLKNCHHFRIHEVAHAGRAWRGATQWRCIHPLVGSRASEGPTVVPSSSSHRWPGRRSFLAVQRTKERAGVRIGGC